ncbi:MAG: CBS domain-containing protein [Acidimicrobiales bacterium]
MSRNRPVREVMTTDVVTFTPDQSVHEAMASMVDRGVDAAPVVDGDGRVVGMLSTGDLIVQETQLHFPTVLSLLGASIELPSSQRHFERDLRRALGASVGEVMSDKPVTCAEDDTLERAATLMHDHEVSRLPVVRDGKLVGLVSRNDILRAILTEG